MESNNANWTVTHYCSACNDPEGSAQACDGKSLAGYQAKTVCAIKDSKKKGLLGKTATVTYPNGKVA